MILAQFIKQKILKVQILLSMSIFTQIVSKFWNLTQKKAIDIAISSNQGRLINNYF